MAININVSFGPRSHLYLPLHQIFFFLFFSWARRLLSVGCCTLLNKTMTELLDDPAIDVAYQSGRPEF